ncbi:MAG: RNA methyltransferase [Deltaproteobacteria bacterium]|nr:RNA methyltransferase [Deltaproteobacteria bacterium]
MTEPEGIGAGHRRREHALGSALIVLVRPRYPENLGAVARAMRVTGFRRLVLVAPLPLATASHEQARKMAVGATHILDDARVVETLAEAIDGVDIVVGTSARHGLREVRTPRTMASEVVALAEAGKSLAIVFGGEREGLRAAELEGCALRVRIPMVANEPSLNLAQAAMIVLYELMVSAFDSGAVAPAR